MTQIRSRAGSGWICVPVQSDEWAVCLHPAAD
jgi:hypothetical protein